MGWWAIWGSPGQSTHPTLDPPTQKAIIPLELVASVSHSQQLFSSLSHKPWLTKDPKPEPLIQGCQVAKCRKVDLTHPPLDLSPCSGKQKQPNKAQTLACTPYSQSRACFPLTNGNVTREEGRKIGNRQNHMEERLLDQAQARASHTPRVFGLFAQHTPYPPLVFFLTKHWLPLTSAQALEYGCSISMQSIKKGSSLPPPHTAAKR